MKSAKRIELLQGTLDLLVLRLVELEPMHGYGLTRRLEQVSRGAFRVNVGSLFPALHQMEEAGWIKGAWSVSENNRKAKYYSITASGRRRLEDRRENWARVSTAIDWVLGES